MVQTFCTAMLIEPMETTMSREVKEIEVKE